MSNSLDSYIPSFQNLPQRRLVSHDTKQSEMNERAILDLLYSDPLTWIFEYRTSVSENPYLT